MLRAQFVADLHAIIDNTQFFRAHEFLIDEAEVKNKYGQPVSGFRIVYLDDTRFFFVSSLPTRRTGGKDVSPDLAFGASCAPGEIAGSQEYEITGKSDLYDQIRAWLNRVREELLAGTLGRQVQEQQRQIGLSETSNG